MNPAPPQSPTGHGDVLRCEQSRLALALACAGMGTWDWNPAEQSVALDPGMHRLCGIEPGSFSGRHADFLQLLHPDDRPHVAAAIDAALRQCAAFDGEFRINRVSDGATRIIRTRTEVICDPEGKPMKVIGASQDVTEQRRTEANLERTHYLLDALMEHLPDYIYFKDRQSRFTCVNKAKLKQHGLSHESEILGKSDFDFFKPERARMALEDELRTMSTGQPLIDHEEKTVWPDGSTTWVSSTKLPLYNTEGQIIGTFGLSRDITKRKHIEEDLARIAQELRTKNEMLEEDLKMARELQSALLPQQYPCFPNGSAGGESAVRFHHFFTPSMEVSGDFFAVCKLSDNRAGIFICDVMGHGMRAALVAAMVRSLVGELHVEREDPSALLAHLNRALRDNLKDSLVPIFASAFYVIVDLHEGELRYANAGHPCPLLMPGEDAAAAPVRLNGIKPGPALGLFDTAKYTSGRRHLSPHDVLLLFTDGLFEVEGPQGDFYDYERLQQAIGVRRKLPTEELCRDVIEEIRHFSGCEQFSDDVCLVAMEVGQHFNSSGRAMAPAVA